MVRIRVRFRLSVWLVSCYAHVFVLHCNLVITLILGDKQNKRYNEIHSLNGMKRIVMDW